MTLPEKNTQQALRSEELITLLNEAVRMTVKVSETLQDNDLAALESLMRARGSMIEKAAAVFSHKYMNGGLLTEQKEADAHLRMTANVLKKSDEELRSLLLKKKAAVLDHIEMIEKQKQIVRYTHAGENPEGTARRTHT